VLSGDPAADLGHVGGVDEERVELDEADPRPGGLEHACPGEQLVEHVI